LIVHYLRTGALLPVFDDDPNDIKIVFNALQRIDSQKQNRVGERCVIDVEDCGAAYRFLMALLAITPGRWLLTGTQRLLERPVLPLVNFLNLQGANIQKTKTGWHIEGKELKVDNVEIDTTETSQFASAIMMVHGLGVTRYAQKNRNPYICMTETILQISCRDTINYIATLSDWSAAVFWLANALLKPDAHYLLKDLHFDKLQGDAGIAPLFIDLGLTFTESEHGIEVKHITYIDIPKQQIDVANTPDIAMILATLSVCYPFELTLSGLKNLNLKESRRLDIMIDELSKYTTINKLSSDAISVNKRTKELPKSFHFDSYNDHRFVMAWSLFKNFGTVSIENSDCIKKSYPSFAPLAGINSNLKS